METWRKVWRVGVHPLLTVDQLESLRKAILSDDPRLIQGATCTPPPLSCLQDWPVEAACLFAFCGVEDHGGFGECKVAEAEEFFAKLCFDMDQNIGVAGGCRHVINWFDETPRDEMRRLLLPEVQRSIAEKEKETVSAFAVKRA